MNRVFFRSYSLVLSPVFPQVMTNNLHLIKDKVFSQLIKLDKSSAPGSGGVNPKLIKSCAVTVSIPILLFYIEGNFL